MLLFACGTKGLKEILAAFFECEQTMIRSEASV